MRAGSSRDRQRLKSAFAALADLPSDARAARLAGIAASDPALADRLSSLLAADDEAGTRLRRFELLAGVPADLTAAGVGDPTDPLGLVGSTVAHFQIRGMLGRGGMGVAYHAEDLRLGRSVALKFLLPEVVDDDARNRFLHEARTASALDHPNICTVLEVGDSPHGHYLAMPAYAGVTLRQRLVRDGRIPPPEAVIIATQVLQGLAAAHAVGITHRDLKPGNLMLTPGGTVKILDFGLAASGDPGLATPGPRAGTVAYMSPEQLLGEEVGPRSDLWAAGVLLYEMLTGGNPYGRAHDLGTVYAILHEDPAPPSSLAPAVPASLDPVVGRLLRREAAQRYADASEVLRALSATTSQPGRGVRLRRKASVLLTLLVIVAAADVMTVAAGPAVGPPHSAAPAVADSVPAPGPVSVAVLPFVDTSPAGDQQHLGDGMAEEILNALIGVPGLRVPARQSSFRVGRGDLPLAELARRLQVDAVLEGSVHRDGDRVRITARLLDPATGGYLWSRTFDRRFRDLFAVQAEIAERVARELEVRLAPGSRRQVLPNMVAYDLHLRGLFHWNRRTAHDLRHAIDFFTQATQHDSTFAQPYAGLALAYAVLPLIDPAAGDLLEQAPRMAARALALDPSLALAHAARGYAYHWQWRWEDAERELERALALEPTLATAHQWYGEHLAKMGRFEQGEAHVRRAIALDPLSLVAQNDLGIVLMLKRRYAESIAQLEGVQRSDPGFPLPLLLLHRVNLIAGNAEAAAGAGRRWAELTEMADPAELALLAAASHDPSLGAEAREVLGRWERLPAPRWPDIALYRVLLGDHDEAIEALERALRARSPMLAQLGVAPWLDPLRRDPRFTAILRQVGLSHAAVDPSRSDGLRRQRQQPPARPRPSRAAPPPP